MSVKMSKSGVSPNERIRKAHIATHPQFNIHNEICYADFFKLIKKFEEEKGSPLTIVELGISSTDHKNDFIVNDINVSKYIITDSIEGFAINKKINVHEFTKVFPINTIDVIFSASTYQHFKYPFVASHELMKSLKIGGYIFIQTHQTFPLTGHSNDFYRFSRVALESLFPKEMNMEVINSWYDFLNEILPSTNVVAESYSNVNLIAKKKGETPMNWIYVYE